MRKIWPRRTSRVKPRPDGRISSNTALAGSRRLSFKDMGTLGGFPNPPAMDSGGPSPPASARSRARMTRTPSWQLLAHVALGQREAAGVLGARAPAQIVGARRRGLADRQLDRRRIVALRRVQRVRRV